MKLKLKKISGGFTLIEVIVTIVVLAILAAIMAPYYGKSFQSFTGSSAPLARLNKSLTLNQVMEIISSQYASIPHWRPNASYTSGTIILPSTRIRNGYRYVSGGGTSGTTQPSWPIASGGTVIDNNITWTISTTCAPPLLSNTCPTGCTTCPTGLSNLIGTEGQNYYTDTQFGSNYSHIGYNVINNHFITFDDTKTEQPCTSSANCIDSAHYTADYGRYLKVTIGFRSDDPNRTGETLSTLFVLR